MANLPLAIRQGRVSDVPFLCSSYVRSLLNQRPWSAGERNWMAASAALLAARMLGRAVVLVAADPKDPDQIYGWIAADATGRILYYTYVKAAFRGAGVGTALMLAAFGDLGSPVRCAHWTDGARKLERRWNLVRDSHPLVQLAKE